MSFIIEKLIRYAMIMEKSDSIWKSCLAYKGKCISVYESNEPPSWSLLTLETEAQQIKREAPPPLQ